MNINTNAHTQKPFYPELASHKFSGSIFQYICIKAATDISILRMEPKTRNISILHPIFFEDFKPTDGFIPGPFSFIPMSSTLILSYENGCLITIDFLKKELINVLNQSASNLTHKPVVQILLDPIDCNMIYLLYEDSTMIKYNINLEENSYFLDKFTKFHEKTSFHTKTNRFIYKHKENDVLELKRSFLETMPELNYFSAYNKEIPMKNPLSYHKFNCSFISKAQIHISPFFERINAKSEKNGKRLAVFAYIGFDGFLRIFDYFWWTPLISYKSHYGGFNSLSFSEKGDLIALAGHDDNITILDLLTYKTLTITGHRSFPTKVLISEPENNIIRVLPSALDSYISISEFDKRVFELETDEFRSEGVKEDRFPKRILYQETERMPLKPLYFLKVSNEGVGDIEYFEGYLFVNGYDGIVSVWNYDTEELKNKGILLYLINMDIFFLL